MSRHHATVSLDGVPLLSHLATPGLILSPAWMPLQTVRALGVAIFGGGENVATGCDYETTEEAAPRVYRKRATVTLTKGRIVGPNHVSYIDCPSVTLEWVGTEDYSR